MGLLIWESPRESGYRRIGITRQRAGRQTEAIDDVGPQSGAVGGTIVKLIDATEGLTELTYKHFNQQSSGVVQTGLYRLRC